MRAGAAPAATAPHKATHIIVSAAAAPGSLKLLKPHRKGLALVHFL
jgi:hypothetical protein